MTFEMASLSDDIKRFGSIVVGPFELNESPSAFQPQSSGVKDRNKHRPKPTLVSEGVEAKRKKTNGAETTPSMTTSTCEEDDDGEKSQSGSIILLSSDEDSDSDGDSEVYDYEQFKREQKKSMSYNLPLRADLPTATSPIGFTFR